MNGRCIFCKIARGEAPADIVYEDEHIIAFRDIHPAAPTHILLIPREHIVNVSDAEPEHRELLGHLILVAAQLANAEGITDGYRLLTNNGAEGGQSVWHLHWHLLGGRRLSWPPG